MSNAEYVVNALPVTELLMQLAEECNELAKAAHKVRRVLDGTNPTPMTLQEAAEDFKEEELDVICCLDLLYNRENKEYLETLDGDYPKLDRWRKRLEEREEREKQEYCRKLTNVFQLNGSNGAVR